MKNFNMLLFWLGFFIFVIFVASNALAIPQIFFLWPPALWYMWIIYVWIIWMVMWWGLNWMLNKKWGSNYDDSDDWEWF